MLVSSLPAATICAPPIPSSSNALISSRSSSPRSFRRDWYGLCSRKRDLGQGCRGSKASGFVVVARDSARQSRTRRAFGCNGASALASARAASSCCSSSSGATGSSSRMNPFRSSSSIACNASSPSSSSSTPAEQSTLVELPLFPLPLVLFPGAILPLQIFEFRYRIMMHTLLQTDLRFGVVFMDRATGLAEVGCVGEIIKHERLVDDRFFLICKGQERFRVASVVRTAPYLVAQVEWVEDKPSEEEGEDLDKLADEVEAYMKDVIRLSNRMNKKPEKETPEDLRKNLFPTPFSFWVGSTFEGAPMEQQALLELEDTATRLKREKETLRNTLNYLTAAAAVKDVFSSQSD